MTGDEVERSIEFLLKNQATLETQIERTSHQVEETNKQLEETNKRLEETNRRLEETNRRLEETNERLEMYAETQTQFIQIVTRHIEAQGEINASLRGAVHELAAAQTRTDARLDRLVETVERFITEGRNGKP